MKRMKQELAKAHSETVTVRRYRGEVMDDLDKEHQAEVSRLLAKIKRLEKENLELARQRDTAKDKLKERTQQYYEVAAELEEERGRNKKLTAQITEYTTKEYRNRKTGARVHAPFSEGYVNEVNYDGKVKALAFLLGNECQKIAEIYGRKRPPKSEGTTDATA